MAADAVRSSTTPSCVVALWPQPSICDPVMTTHFKEVTSAMYASNPKSGWRQLKREPVWTSVPGAYTKMLGSEEYPVIKELREKSVLCGREGTGVPA